MIHGAIPRSDTRGNAVRFTAKPNTDKYTCYHFFNMSASLAFENVNQASRLNWSKQKGEK